MFDRAWLEKALELQKSMKEMTDHSWHFDKSWLDKAMEMQKMIPGMGIDSNWYKDMLGSVMKGHPGSGMFNFQDSGESGDRQDEEETAGASGGAGSSGGPRARARRRPPAPRVPHRPAPGSRSLRYRRLPARSRSPLIYRGSGAKTIYPSGCGATPFTCRGKIRTPLRGGMAGSWSFSGRSGCRAVCAATEPALTTPTGR